MFALKLLQNISHDILFGFQVGFFPGKFLILLVKFNSVCIWRYYISEALVNFTRIN